MERTAVVTGASNGIGRATVEKLLRDGWEVWGLDLEAAADGGDIGNGKYHHEICNIAEPKSIEAAFARIAAQTPSLGALVCNAGVTITGELDAITLEEVDLMYNVNLRGPWLTIRAALPLLKVGGSVDDPKRVVVTGSAGGIRPKVGNGFYSAMKQAVHTVTKICAVEMGPLGITFNAVAPGTTDTRMPREAAARAAAAGSAFQPSGRSPLGRIGKPEDVADAIMFFLGDQAKYINGTILPVDGGGRAAYVGVAQGLFQDA